MRMVRKGDWNLVLDMEGNGQLYHLVGDPAEVDNCYGRPELASIQQELMAELLAWILRVQDLMPLPRKRDVMKTDTRSYIIARRCGWDLEPHRSLSTTSFRLSASPPSRDFLTKRPRSPIRLSLVVCLQALVRQRSPIPTNSLARRNVRLYPPDAPWVHWVQY